MLNFKNSFNKIIALFVTVNIFLIGIAYSKDVSKKLSLINPCPDRSTSLRVNHGQEDTYRRISIAQTNSNNFQINLLTEYGISVSVRRRSEEEIVEELKRKKDELAKDATTQEKDELEREYYRLSELLKGKERCNRAIWSDNMRFHYLITSMGVIPYFMESMPRDNALRVYLLRDAGFMYQYDLMLGILAGEDINAATFYCSRQSLEGIGKDWEKLVISLNSDYTWGKRIWGEEPTLESFDRRLEKGFEKKFERDPVFQETALFIYHQLENLGFFDYHHIRFIDNGFYGSICAFLKCVIQHYRNDIKIDVFTASGHADDDGAYKVYPQFRSLEQKFEKQNFMDKLSTTLFKDMRFGRVAYSAHDPHSAIVDLEEGSIHDDYILLRHPVLFDDRQKALIPSPPAHRLNWFFWTLVRINQAMSYCEYKTAAILLENRHEIDSHEGRDIDSRKETFSTVVLTHDDKTEVKPAGLATGLTRFLRGLWTRL